MTTPRTAVRISTPAGASPELALVVDQMNAVLARLQSGGLLLGGLKLDATRTAAPTDPPGSGDPTCVSVNVGGTVKLYFWTGAAWIVVGTQT